MRRFVLLLLLLPLSALATTGSAAAGRLALAQARIESGPPASEHYTLRGRIAARESAGELREGARFTAIGRLAKAAPGCAPGSGAIFRDGFE